MRTRSISTEIETEMEKSRDEDKSRGKSRDQSETSRGSEKSRGLFSNLTDLSSPTPGSVDFSQSFYVHYSSIRSCQVFTDKNMSDIFNLLK